MRKVFKTHVDGAHVFCTFHVPSREETAPAQEPVQYPIGILLLNMGHAARACHGNLVARLADALAHVGYPVVRMDFPGVGDSPGELPLREEPFWRFLTRGGFTPLTQAAVAHLGDRLRIEKFVIGGLCAGAVAAILAACAIGQRVVGVMLLEGSFTVPSLVRHRSSADAKRLSSLQLHGLRQILLKVLRTPSSWARAVTGRSQYRSHLLTLWSLLHDRVRVLCGMRLPEDANVTMIDCWKRLVRDGVPGLVMFAGGHAHEALYLQVTDAVLPRRLVDAVVTRHSIPETNHTFTTQGADETVIGAVVAWMQQTFPVPRGAMRSVIGVQGH